MRILSFDVAKFIYLCRHGTSFYTKIIRKTLAITKKYKIQQIREVLPVCSDMTEIFISLF